MTEYVFPHSAPDEDQRLTMMSQMLDPHTCFRLSQLEIQENWQCLEVAAGNGSLSHWLGGQLGEGGHVRCTDIETGFLKRIDLPNVTVERLDLTTDEIGEGTYDLVFGRAFLHHLPTWHGVIDKLAGAVKPGGAMLLQEPDFHPAFSTDNAAIREIWERYAAWAQSRGIDYFLGRKIASRLQELGFEDIEVHGETISFNGGSLGANFYDLNIELLGPQMAEAGFVTQRQLDEFHAMMIDPRCWSMVSCFTATSARKPG